MAFQNDDQYQQEQSQYWSTAQSDLRPACRLTPTTTQHTSDFLRYLHDHAIDFAIANGGHSTVLGASNLDTGITLDLSHLASISAAEDEGSVTIGTGARWSDVYNRLDPLGTTVAGARAGSVGTGGFLLGGGISILAPMKGWSCDTLISIEVVLADGTILHVDEAEHADIFKALKGGGSNFGVATSFTMQTLPFDMLQVAYLRFEWDQIEELLRQVATCNQDAHLDSNTSLDVSMAFDPDTNEPFAMLMVTRLGRISESQILRPFFEIQHSSNGVQDVAPSEVAREVNLNNPRGYR